MVASRILIGVGGVMGLIAALGSTQSTTQPADASDARAHCMFVPQRLDDFAWENDRVAFRAYGPALEKQDGPQSGFDIWVKRVPRLVQADWYKTGDYHTDHGEGLDGYKVGSSRGCGGTAVVHDGKLIPSGNYTAHRILENGPDRVVFELDYGPWDVAGTSVKETKRITLAAGSDFNEIASTFTFDGPPLTVAIGLKRHDAGKVIDAGAHAIATWEPLDGEGNGSLGCGIIVGGTPKRVTIDKDECLTIEVRSGEPITYHAGGGWSKAGFAEADAWRRHVSESASKLTGASK